MWILLTPWLAPKIFKAALIHVLMDLITTCNVNGDKLTKNYYGTLQFPTPVWILPNCFPHLTQILHRGYQGMK